MVQSRIALVTGASRGLGQAVARGLVGAGYRVVGISRSQVDLDLLATEIGASFLPIAGDVSDLQFMAAVQERVVREWGTVEILVNAAGVFGPIALIHESDPGEWVQTLMIDTVAPYLSVRTFLPGMLRSRWGRIINVSSAAALHPPGPLNSAYGVAKVALNQLTRHLAAEISGSGVSANVIHPGDVKTEMWADVKKKAAALGEMGVDYQAWVDWVDETGGDDPAKVVELVLELVSDASAQINGRFCWIRDPLQAPIASWEDPQDMRPWA